MNKHNLINIALKELEELKIMLNGMKDMENVPSIIFQLSDAKFNNLGLIFNQLKDENDAPANNSIEEKTEEEVPKLLAEVETVEKEIVAESICVEEIEETQPAGLVVEEKLIVEEEEVTEEEIQEVVAEKEVVEENEAEEEEIPEVIAAPETSKIKVEKPKKKNIIGETIIEKTSSVKEKLSAKATVSLDKTLSEKKITDLKKSINVNDKFRFTRELFNGNASLLNQTLDVLNEVENKDEALDFLSSFEWEANDQTVSDFMELINRKFL